MTDRETKSYLRQLSDEELRSKSLEKDPKTKRYTHTANLAQAIRNERAGQVMPKCINGKKPKHIDGYDWHGRNGEYDDIL